MVFHGHIFPFMTIKEGGHEDMSIKLSNREAIKEDFLGKPSEGEANRASMKLLLSRPRMGAPPNRLRTISLMRR